MTNMPLMPQISFAEYEAAYADALPHHEFVDGYVRAMAGGSRAHSALIARLAALLDGPAGAHGCAMLVERRLDIAFGADDTPSRSYYPDAIVVCDPVERSAAERYPCLVIEVLSDSTAAIDQIEKRAAYCRITSVETYLVVSQSERRVVVHRRDGEEIRSVVVEEGSVVLDCPPTELSIDALYATIIPPT